MNQNMHASVSEQKATNTVMKTDRKTFDGRLYVILLAVMTAITVWWLYSAVSGFITRFTSDNAEDFSRPAGLGVLALIVIATICLLSDSLRHRLIRLLQTIVHHPKQVFIAMLVWQAIVFLCLMFSYTAWDPTAATAQAVSFILHPEVPSPSLSVYPNNSFLVLLEMAPAALLHAVFGSRIPESTYAPMLTMVMQVINIAVIDLSIIWIRHIVKRFSDRAADYAFLFLVLLIGCSIWTMIPYTDTLGLPFNLLVITLILRVLYPSSSKRHGTSARSRTAIRTFLLFAAIGIASFLAYALKPSCIIPTIAFVIVWFVINWGKKLLTVFLPTTLALALGFGVAAVPVTAAEKAFLTYDASQAVPMTHYLMMGMQGHGSYNKAEVNATQSHATKQEKVQFNLQTVRQRLSDYGPVGYLTFLLRKGFYSLQQGALGASYTGQKTATPPNKGTQLIAVSEKNPVYRLSIPILKDIQNYLLDKNPNHLLYCLFQQIVYVILIIGMLLCLIQRFRSDRRTRFAIQPDSDRCVFAWFILALFGGIMFLMLFEAGSSRYLIQFLPLILILGSAGLTERTKEAKITA